MGDDTKNLLKTCAENLLNAVSRLENRSQDQNEQVPAAASSSSVSDEHRRLFGYRPPSSTSRAASSSRGNSQGNSRGSTSTSVISRQGAPKRRVITTATGQRVAIPVSNTWTRTFVYLQKKNAVNAPSMVDKVNMAMAGLEEKNICFTKGGNSDHVHLKILEAFPMLEEAGGYEILRTGERGNRLLMVLSIPPGGYTVVYLKATIASAKGYLRPLQKDLVFHSATTEQYQTQVGGCFHELSYVLFMDDYTYCIIV